MCSMACRASPAAWCSWMAGSTDGTLERLDAIAARDESVEIYSL
jgi:hypothetical protein